MNSQRLMYFARVADVGSLTEAAESLGITQPSLSSALRKLELEIGVTLLTRHGRGVTLTAEGLQLLEHARRAIEELNRFADVASLLRSDDYGTVSIAAPAGVRISVLTPLAAAFLKRHPHNQVRVERTLGLADTVEAVRRGQAELALLPRLAVPDAMEGLEVGSYELALALPPGCRLPPGDVEPSLLADMPFISSLPGTVAERVMQSARRHGARPRIVMIEPDFGLLPQLVSRGVGAAIVVTAQREQLAGMGVETRLFSPRERWTVRLVRQRGTLPPTATRFLSLAEEIGHAGRHRRNDARTGPSPSTAPS